MAITEQYQPYYLYGSYVVWGFTFFLFCCVLCNTKNIKIGVAVMKCTAQYIAGNPHVFLVPPMASAIVVLWMVLYIVIAAFIISVGELKPRADLKFLSTVVWNNET